MTLLDDNMRPAFEESSSSMRFKRGAHTRMTNDTEGRERLQFPEAVTKYCRPSQTP